MQRTDRSQLNRDRRDRTSIVKELGRFFHEGERELAIRAADAFDLENTWFG
jgi:hypothetical protein